MVVIFALIVIGLPAAWVLAHIIHFFSVGSEGIKAEWKAGEELADKKAQIERDRIKMRKEVDEIFRRQRERMKNKN